MKLETLLLCAQADLEGLLETAGDETDNRPAKTTLKTITVALEALRLGRQHKSVSEAVATMDMWVTHVAEVRASPREDYNATEFFVRHLIDRSNEPT